MTENSPKQNYDRLQSDLSRSDLSTAKNYWWSETMGFHEVMLPVTTRFSWRCLRICGNPYQIYQQAIAKSQEEELAEWLASDGWILWETSPAKSHCIEKWRCIIIHHLHFGMSMHIGSQKAADVQPSWDDQHCVVLDMGVSQLNGSSEQT